MRARILAGGSVLWDCTFRVRGEAADEVLVDGWEPLVAADDIHRLARHWRAFARRREQGARDIVVDGGNLLRNPPN